MAKAQDPFAAIRALLEEGLSRGHFAGAGALVASPVGTLFEAYAGDARVEPAAEARPATAETLWDLASLTKPLAGASLVLRLHDQKALSLEDGVGRFGDAFKRTRFHGVTLRALLSHTAGLLHWFPCYVRGEGREAYRRTLADLDPAGRPGDAVLYSCLGYLLLAEVVERVSGADLSLLFRESVSKPLGVAGDLLFSPQGEDLPRTAGGERDDATERRMTAERGLSYAGFRAGVVNGTPNDGNAYRRAGGLSLNAGLFGTLRAVGAAGLAWLVRDTRLLSEASFAEAAQPVLLRDGREGRPLGWEFATAENAGGEAISGPAFGHTGFTGGSLFVDPARTRVYVLLANRLHPDARAVDINAYRKRFHAAAVGL